MATKTKEAAVELTAEQKLERRHGLNYATYSAAYRSGSKARQKLEGKATPAILESNQSAYERRTGHANDSGEVAAWTDGWEHPDTEPDAWVLRPEGKR